MLVLMGGDYIIKIKISCNEEFRADIESAKQIHKAHTLLLLGTYEKHGAFSAACPSHVLSKSRISGISRALAKPRHHDGQRIFRNPLLRDSLKQVLVFSVCSYAIG